MPRNQDELAQGKVKPTSTILPEPRHQEQPLFPAGQPAAVQRARILARLRIGSATTQQLRDELHVMHPAARVLDLRQLGFNIHTNRLPSRMAEYHLIGRDVTHE